MAPQYNAWAKPPRTHNLDSYTRVMMICRLVNSRRPAASQSKIGGTMHSGANRMGSPDWRNAWVSERSSLPEPFQNSSTLLCSKRSRRIAVPPPQQKFWWCSPRYVAAGAFQADARGLQEPPVSAKNPRNE